MSGGGDKLPVIFPLGIMMLFLGGLSLFFHFMNQNKIVAALIVGLMVGGFGWDESMQLEDEIKYAFIELGNVLILFFAGLSTDLSSFATYRKQIFLISAIQFTSYAALFAGLSIGLGLTNSSVSSIFFGIACIMSSTIAVKGHISYWGEESMLHSKILLGIMVLQDTTAAFSFVIIHAFSRIKRSKDHLHEHDPERTISEIFDIDRAGPEVGRAVGIFAAFVLILFLIKRYVLDKVFKYFRKDDEMLFIGSMAYNFGISALCQLIGFSPMAGAYFAGLNLSFLPTRGQIESKISSLRAFGMTNFYFMLGIYVHIDADSLRRLLPYSILIAVIVGLVLPVLWVTATRLMRLRGRTRFYLGCMSNSMGEFSLIIQNLCFNANIFDRDTHIVLLFASIITMIITTISQRYKHRVYYAVGSQYTLDKSTAESVERDHQFKCEGHVVLLGLNEVNKLAAEVFRKKGLEVAMMDVDPELCRALLKVYQSHKEEQRDLGVSAQVGHAIGAQTDQLGGLSDYDIASPGFISPTNDGPAVLRWEDSTALERQISVAPDRATSGGWGLGLGVQRVSTEQTRRASREATSLELESGSNRPRPKTESRNPISLRSPFSGRWSRSSKRLRLWSKPTDAMGTNILPIYTDPRKPVVWHRYRLDQALLVVSALEESRLNGLNAFLKENGVAFITTARRLARQKGAVNLEADYTVHQEYLASRYFAEMLREEEVRPIELRWKEKGKKHEELLKEEASHRHRKTLVDHV